MSRLTDITVYMHHRTELAVLVSDKGDRDKAVWLPLSAVEINSENGAILEITLPEAMALDKGLI